MKVAIYLIRSPLDNTVRYVGASVRPKHRFSDHITCANAKNHSPLYVWMWELLKTGHRPLFEIVEWCEATEAAKREWTVLQRYPDAINKQRKPASRHCAKALADLGVKGTYRRVKLIY